MIPSERQARRERAEQRRRARLGLCWCCGGDELVEATDSDGGRHVGCARCIIVLPEAAARPREEVRP